MEEDARRPRDRNALARARETFGRAAGGAAERLRRGTERVAGAFGSAAGRLKETPAGEKLGATFEIRRVLKRAADARARGNLPMAYRLLEAELRERPGEPKVAVAFWEAAQACERLGEAAELLLPVIRKLTASDAAEAARLWSELVGVLPDARADAGSLVRMVPALLERDAALAVRALQHAIDPGATGLTPGLAVRVAEYARVLDPPTALRAARLALDAPDLHQTRRQALGELVREIERDAASPSPSPAPEAAAPAPPAEAPPPAAPATAGASSTAAPSAAGEGDLSEAVAPPALESALESLAPATRFHGIKRMTSLPSAFGEDALELAVGEDRRGRLEYAKIEAIAVAEIAELAPDGVVVDLVLNWSDSSGGPLRLVRLRPGEFDAAALAGAAPGDANGLRAFVAKLLERSGALALPDGDALSGGALRVFESTAEYEREVLQTESAADAARPRGGGPSGE